MVPLSFFEFLANRADDLLEAALQHALVVGAAIVLSTILGVILGVIAFQRPRLRDLILSMTGAILTIPSFALFILLLGPLGLGVRPVLVALTLYGLLPVVRNTVAGLNDVSPAVVESARGMGLSAWQRLTKVQLPLAWPVIITGVRVSTLMLLGIAAIGAIVNGPGLGSFIFTGLARVGTPAAVNLALAGTLGVIVLAIIFDGLFYLIQRLTTSKGIR